MQNGALYVALLLLFCPTTGAWAGTTKRLTSVQAAQRIPLNLPKDGKPYEVSVNRHCSLQFTMSPRSAPIFWGPEHTLRADRAVRAEVRKDGKQHAGVEFHSLCRKFDLAPDLTVPIEKRCDSKPTIYNMHCGSSAKTIDSCLNATLDCKYEEDEKIPAERCMLGGELSPEILIGFSGNIQTLDEGCALQPPPGNYGDKIVLDPKLVDPNSVFNDGTLIKPTPTKKLFDPSYLQEASEFIPPEK